jgi:hypothetical protein
MRGLHHRMPLHAEVAPAQVVGEEDDDVGRPGSGAAGGGKRGQGEEKQGSDTHGG